VDVKSRKTKMEGVSPTVVTTKAEKEDKNPNNPRVSRGREEG